MFEVVDSDESLHCSCGFPRTSFPHSYFVKAHKNLGTLDVRAHGGKHFFRLPNGKVEIQHASHSDLLNSSRTSNTYGVWSVPEEAKRVYNKISCLPWWSRNRPRHFRLTNFSVRQFVRVFPGHIKGIGAIRDSTSQSRFRAHLHLEMPLLLSRREYNQSR